MVGAVGIEGIVAEFSRVIPLDCRATSSAVSDPKRIFETSERISALHLYLATYAFKVIWLPWSRLPTTSRKYDPGL